MTEDKKIEDKWWGEAPFLSELPIYTQNVRRNLISFCLISIIWVIYDVKFDFENYGIEFGKMPNAEWWLFGILAYHFIHFYILSITYFRENRIRLTGIDKPDTYTIRGEDTENSPDPRQATLYLWWKEKKKDFPNINQKFINDNPSLAQQVDNIGKVFKNERIEKSLERFHKYFKIFGIEQCIRFVIDIFFPLFVAGFSLLLLANKLDFFGITGTVLTATLLYYIWALIWKKHSQ